MSTDDSPKREFDVYEDEGLPPASLAHEESTLNHSEREATPNRSNPMGNRNRAESHVVRCGGLIWVRQITAWSRLDGVSNTV